MPHFAPAAEWERQWLSKLCKLGGVPMYKLSELTAQYKAKLVTAEQAVAGIKSGDRVHYGLFNGIVVELDKALAKRAPEQIGRASCRERV